MTTKRGTFNDYQLWKRKPLKPKGNSRGKHYCKQLNINSQSWCAHSFSRELGLDVFEEPAVKRPRLTELLPSFTELFPIKRNSRFEIQKEITCTAEDTLCPEVHSKTKHPFYLLWRINYSYKEHQHLLFSLLTVRIDLKDPLYQIISHNVLYSNKQCSNNLHSCLLAQQTKIKLINLWIFALTCRTENREQNVI